MALELFDSEGRLVGAEVGADGGFQCDDGTSFSRTLHYGMVPACARTPDPPCPPE